MNKGIDLVGRRFGTLTVTDRKASRPKHVVCICDCGEIREVLKKNLLAGNTKTCGKTACRKALREAMNTPVVASMPGMDYEQTSIKDYLLEYDAEGVQLDEMLNTPFENRRRVLDINNKYKKEFKISKKPTPSKRNMSGYAGVNWNKKTKVWQARIGFRGESLYLGNYKICEEAIRARKEAEDMLFAPAIEIKKKFHKKSYKCVDNGSVA